LEVKQLAKVNVGANILNNLFDCSILLKYLPYVEKFEVKAGDDIDVDKMDRNDSSSKTNALYSKVKILNFRAFLPETDKELLYIMETFKELDLLNIDDGCSNESWPSASLSARIMASFMDFLVEKKLYSFSFAGSCDVDWFMDIYYKIINNLDQNNLKPSLHINFDSDSRNVSSALLYAQDQ
jgi:hypothetical protein